MSVEYIYVIRNVLRFMLGMCSTVGNMVINVNYYAYICTHTVFLAQEIYQVNLLRKENCQGILILVYSNGKLYVIIIEPQIVFVQGYIP